MGLIDKKRKDALKGMSATHFLVCEGLSNDDVGEAKSIQFQETRPGAYFKTLGGVP